MLSDIGFIKFKKKKKIIKKMLSDIGESLVYSCGLNLIMMESRFIFVSLSNFQAVL